MHESDTVHTVRAAGRLAGLGLVALLAGCAVGPDFIRPAAPAVGAYTPDGTPSTLAAGAGETEQRLAVGEQIAADWWDLFRSTALSDTVRRALDGNPTLDAARANLAQAREAVTEARAALYPQIDVAGSAERSQGSSSGGRRPPAFDLLSLGPSVSYSPDVFGGTRRRVEEQAALADDQRYQLAATYLTLTTNVVSEAIDVAGVRLEIAEAEAIVADDERNLDLVRTKFDVGKAARTDVLSAETQLANDRAQLPPLRQELSTARHALSILVGRFPAEWSPPDIDLGALTLPDEVPVSLPSALVHQRPDILAAEATLHAASAAIGVATADLYPSIELSASAGQAATMAGMLFAGSSTVWSLASSVTAPIFHGGALAAARRSAVDAFEGSLATYRLTVLQAFGQVADTLDALAHDADLVAAERHAVDVASDSLALQRLSYREGKSDLLQLLDSERLDQQARLGYARAQTQRFEDTTRLFLAMGGGWWNAPVVAAS